MFAGTNGCRSGGCITSLYFFLRVKVWLGIAAGCLFLAVLMSTEAFAQQGGVSIDSFRVLNTTPDFVDIELIGSNDGSMERLRARAVAKSKDGSIYSQGSPSFAVPTEKQFRVIARVRRPQGLMAQKTDVLKIFVYQSVKDVILKQKFDFPVLWAGKSISSADEADEHEELSAAGPWRAFQWSLEEEDWEALDELIKKWNNPKERDGSGEWKLNGFRSVFVNYSSKGRDWKGDLLHIKKWRDFNPKSAGAAIAEAKYWAAYAWHIRGNDTGAQTDPVALRVFGERMQRAEQILKDAKDFSADTPLWYEAYLDIAVATKRDEKFIEALFSEAIRRQPYFQPLYLDMAKYWASRFAVAVDWNKADEVIKQAASNTESMDGAGNYAMLYAQLDELQEFEYSLFENGDVSWIKLRDAFEDLVKRYPSIENLNKFAAFSCQAGDKDTFLKIRPKIINRILPNMWPGNYSYDLCDRRFMQNV